MALWQRWDGRYRQCGTNARGEARVDFETGGSFEVTFWKGQEN